MPVHPFALPILMTNHVINMPPISSNILDSSFRVQIYTFLQNDYMEKKKLNLFFSNLFHSFQHWKVSSRIDHNFGHLLLCPYANSRSSSSRRTLISISAGKILIFCMCGILSVAEV